MNPMDYARQRTTLSPLMEGRAQIKMDDIIGKELTLIDFDMIQLGKDEPFPVCIFEEYPDNFAFGGFLLTDLITGLYSNFGESTKEEVKACGGIKMRLSRRKSKTDTTRTYTVIEVPDENGKYRNTEDVKK